MVFPYVRYDGVTYPVGKTIIKAKQWAFGLRPIHLSRAFESGEAPERGKNGKQHDPGSTASIAKRDIAKKLISRLTVCELYDPRVLLFGISYYLANKVQIDDGKKFKKHFLLKKFAAKTILRFINSSSVKIETFAAANYNSAAFALFSLF